MTISCVLCIIHIRWLFDSNWRLIKPYRDERKKDFLREYLSVTRLQKLSAHSLLRNETHKLDTEDSSPLTLSLLYFLLSIVFSSLLIPMTHGNHLPFVYSVLHKLPFFVCCPIEMMFVNGTLPAAWLLNLCCFYFSYFFLKKHLILYLGINFVFLPTLFYLLILKL